MNAQPNGIAKTSGGVKIVVAQNRPFKGINTHARKETRPMRNASQSHRFGIVALESIAHGCKITQWVVPHFAIDDMNDIFFGDT